MEFKKRRFECGLKFNIPSNKTPIELSEMITEVLEAVCGVTDVEIIDPIYEETE